MMSRLTGHSAWLLLLWTVGCQQPLMTAPATDADQPAHAPAAEQTAAEDDPPADAASERWILELEVHRCSAPLPALSDSQSLWRTADGDWSRSEETLLLRDNGLRAGIGSEQDRLELDQALRSIDGLRSRTDRVVPDPNRPVEVTLDRRPGRRAVTFFDRLGRLEGMSVENAAGRWLVQIDPDWSRGEGVKLTLRPELHEPPGTPDWVMTEHGPVQRQSLSIRRFPGLTATACVPPGGFLMIGADRAAFDSPSVGRAMFEDSGGGDGAARRETILIFVPRRQLQPAP